MRHKNNSFKPDTSITVVKGFPVKGSHVFTDVKDLTIDMKDAKKDEQNG